MNTFLSGRCKTWGVLAAAACIALAVGAAACGGGGGGSGNGPGSEQLDLVIGDELPLGGEGAQGGTGSEDGATTSEQTTTSEETTTSERTTTSETTTSRDTTASGETTTSDRTASAETTGADTATTPADTGAPGGSELGSSGEKASDLAVEQIQAAIDNSGADHTVRVVHADQGTDPDEAAKKASRLVNSDGANCLTGPWSAESFLKAAESVAIPSRVLAISPTPTSEEIADLRDRDLVNSTSLPVTLEGTALAKAISGDLGGADGYTVNVAASNDSYGDSLTEGFIESWQGQDGTVGGQIVIAPPPLSSSSSSGYSSVYSTQARQITTGSPDAIVLVVDPETLANLGGSLGSSYGWDPEIVWGGDQLVTPALPDDVGSDVVTGMRALAPGIPKKDEAAAAFTREFKSAAPHDVRLAPFAAQQFDATILCYLAAVAAGSTDGQAMADKLIDITAPGGARFTWQQLPDAIEALENGEDIDYNGASGPIDMDIRGAPTSGVYDIYQFTEDGLEVAGEVSVSKPNPATP